MRYVLLFILLVVGLAGCGGGSSDNGEGGAVLSEGLTGELTLGISDGPVENASALVVAFSSVEVHGAQDITIDLEEIHTINLLDFQGENRLLLLDGESLAAGDYQWIRLAIDEERSYIEVAGEQYNLAIPSGAESGLKLNQNFTIAADSSSDFTIDFDLRKSVHQTGTGEYRLRPTLRLVDSLAATSFSASIDESFIINMDCNNGDNNDIGNVVYLFEGHDVVPQDIQGNDSDPIVTASVTYNEQSESYDYLVAQLAYGDYTVAFTCDASLDVSDEDNSTVVNFSVIINITVSEDS